MILRDSKCCVCERMYSSFDPIEGIGGWCDICWKKKDHDAVASLIPGEVVLPPIHVPDYIQSCTNDANKLGAKCRHARLCSNSTFNESAFDVFTNYKVNWVKCADCHEMLSVHLVK